MLDQERHTRFIAAVDALRQLDGVDGGMALHHLQESMKSRVEGMRGRISIAFDEQKHAPSFMTYLDYLKEKAIREELRSLLAYAENDMRASELSFKSAIKLWTEYDFTLQANRKEYDDLTAPWRTVPFTPKRRSTPGGFQMQIQVQTLNSDDAQTHETLAGLRNYLVNSLTPVISPATVEAEIASDRSIRFSFHSENGLNDKAIQDIEDMFWNAMGGRKEAASGLALSKLETVVSSPAPGL